LPEYARLLERLVEHGPTAFSASAIPGFRTESPDLALEEQADDMAAVMGTAGSGSAEMFAAARPERETAARIHKRRPTSA
jgi:hypothetical protein